MLNFFLRFVPSLILPDTSSLWVVPFHLKCKFQSQNADTFKSWRYIQLKCGDLWLDYDCWVIFWQRRDSLIQIYNSDESQFEPLVTASYSKLSTLQCAIRSFSTWLLKVRQRDGFAGWRQGLWFSLGGTILISYLSQSAIGFAPLYQLLLG